MPTNIGKEVGLAVTACGNQFTVDDAGLCRKPQDGRGDRWESARKIDPIRRRRYKAQMPVRQMLVATIICLYCGEPDKTWLSRLPSTWLAADAVAAMLEAGPLRDWGRLVAMYPGW
jgi:hypothetical protein